MAVAEPPLEIGRYVLHDEIASGGMAKVHLGRAIGAVGFSRIVAIKRILPHLLGDQEFVEMFIDETRLAARIQHPNVVSTLDAVVIEGEVFLVMEHVLGESAARLFRTARKHGLAVPINIPISIACGVLRGLHAAHETRSDQGELLGVVHRDVSPQNVLIGVDGVTRLIDFGVAKARGRLQTTREGKIKGKLAYMSPEQLRAHEPDRRTDIYATGVILWEALAGRRLHQGDNDAIVFANVLDNPVYPPSRFARNVPPMLDAVVMRAISRDPSQRYATAEEMALALEYVVQPASPTAVGEWVRQLGGDVLVRRANRIAEIERGVYVPTSSRKLVVTESGSLPNDTGSGSRSGSRSGSHNSAASARGMRAPGATDDSAAGFGRSMAHEAPSKTPRLVVPIIAGALSASLIASVLIVFFVGRGRAPHPASVPTTRAVSAANTAPSTSAATPLAPSEDPATPTASASANASASPSALAALGTESASTQKPVSPPPKPTPSPTSQQQQARPPTKSCDPPWYLDAKNIKRFKPECM